jgi:hypothetical protein
MSKLTPLKTAPLSHSCEHIFEFRGVHTSVNAARMSACATKSSSPMGTPLRLGLGLLLCPLIILFAADPAWLSKPIAQWDAEDAKQVLTNSPWVKYARPALLPELTEAQRREGGQMGGGKGVGLQELSGGGKARAASGYAGALTVRWESALPVRVAELKAKEIGAPDWDGDFYAIAVYDVPGLKATNSEASILKREALLKRDGKKDIKPERVDILPRANGLAIVVYLFPQSDEISRDDKRVRFAAQIARLYLERDFEPLEMVFQGKLQL